MHSVAVTPSCICNCCLKGLCLVKSLPSQRSLAAAFFVEGCCYVTVVAWDYRGSSLSAADSTIIRCPTAADLEWTLLLLLLLAAGADVLQ